jgi:hypothetical protein
MIALTTLLAVDWIIACTTVIVKVATAAEAAHCYRSHKSKGFHYGTAGCASSCLCDDARKELPQRHA